MKTLCYKKSRAACIIAVLIILLICVVSAFAESCSEAGTLQYQASGCDTFIRSCCGNGTWSDWGGECSGEAACSSSQCWDGSKCQDKPSDSGTTKLEECATFGISYTCVSGEGWQRSRTYLYPNTSSSATSCWNGSECVEKPSTCGAESTDSYNCKVYSNTCSCSAGSGWSVSKTLTKCNGSLVPRGNTCQHVGGLYLWIPGEANPSVSGTTCSFSSSSIYTCGSLKYAAASAGSSNSCVLKNYPQSGYNTRMGMVSGY